MQVQASAIETFAVLGESVLGVILEWVGVSRKCATVIAVANELTIDRLTIHASLKLFPSCLLPEVIATLKLARSYYK